MIVMATETGIKIFHVFPAKEEHLHRCEKDMRCKCIPVYAIFCAECKGGQVESRQPCWLCGGCGYSDTNNKKKADLILHNAFNLQP